MSIFLHACYRRCLRIPQMFCLFCLCPEKVLVGVCKVLAALSPPQGDAMRLARLWTLTLFANSCAVDRAWVPSVLQRCVPRQSNTIKQLLPFVGVLSGPRRTKRLLVLWEPARLQRSVRALRAPGQCAGVSAPCGFDDALP